MLRELQCTTTAIVLDDGLYKGNYVGRLFH